MNTTNDNTNNGESHLAFEDSSSTSMMTSEQSADSKLRVPTSPERRPPSDELPSKPMKILFLSDRRTGGGHQASAEALSKQFSLQFPGCEVEICNLWEEANDLLSRGMGLNYSKMASRPWQWRLFYHLTNNNFGLLLADRHFRLSLMEHCKKRLLASAPDVVISVHPTMNRETCTQCRIIGKEMGKHIPYYTVVTDLGSAHSMWFFNGVNKVFVASNRLREIAKIRGFEDSRIVMSGLPIRHGFAHQSDKLGDRTSVEGKLYQKSVKQQLGIDSDKPMVLVMGGGDGVGSLSEIVDQLYVKLTLQGVDATVCVVCGRNKTLKENLDSNDWNAVMEKVIGARKSRSPRNARHNRNPKIDISIKRAEETLALPESPPRGRLVKLISRLPGIQMKEFEYPEKMGCVDVVGLGFITNMPEYMVGADVLVSKAGPGTIAEAASVGLPIMLASFLPGQEAGNVDVVLEAGFGDFCEDPAEIAHEVGYWLQDRELLGVMSKAAKTAGRPHAADEIVHAIGTETMRWLECNERWKGDPVYSSLVEVGHELIMDDNRVKHLTPSRSSVLSVDEENPVSEGSEKEVDLSKRIGELPSRSGQGKKVDPWLRRRDKQDKRTPLTREKQRIAQSVALRGVAVAESRDVVEDDN